MVQWFLVPTDVASGSRRIPVIVGSGATEPVIVNEFINIPQGSQMIRLVMGGQSRNGRGNLQKSLLKVITWNIEAQSSPEFPQTCCE